MPDEQGLLRIAAERGGTIEEITSLLSDLQGAYLALYHIDRSNIRLRRLGRIAPLELLLGMGYVLPTVDLPADFAFDPQNVSPDDRLVVNRIRIESPGFWEFMGALNPLQQIREYLNDRHKRRQDRDFREAAEKEKLRLENELIRRQIYEKENSLLIDRIKIYKELGYSNEDIDGLLWRNIGVPLSRLGRHQDALLIGGSHDGRRDSKAK